MDNRVYPLRRSATVQAGGSGVTKSTAAEDLASLPKEVAEKSSYPRILLLLLFMAYRGDARVECPARDAEPGDVFTAEALQSFLSRMVKRG